MQDIVIKRAHDTHLGVQATKKMVNIMSWWPEPGKNDKKIISSCSECSKEKSDHELRKLSIPSQMQSHERDYTGIGLYSRRRQQSYYCRRWFWSERILYMRRPLHGKVIHRLTAIVGDLGSSTHLFPTMVGTLSTTKLSRGYRLKFAPN